MIALLWRRGAITRLVLGIVALALGGGSILGTQLAATALRQQASAAVELAAGTAQYDIQPFNHPGFTRAQDLAISRLPAVASSQPLLEKADLARLPSGGFRQVVLVAALDHQVALRQLPMVRGSAPGSEFQIAVSQTLSPGVSIANGKTAAGSIALGQSLRLVQSAGDHLFRVTGVVADSGPGAPFGDDTVYVTQKAALALFPSGLQTSDVAVRLRAGSTLSELFQQLSAKVHTEYTVANPRAVSQGDPVAQLNPLLDGITALSLLLAFAVITTTFSSVVLERRRELGLVRLAGASRLLVLRSFLTEALLASALGGALGVGLGYWVAAALIRLSAPADQSPAAVLRWNPPWTLGAFLLVLLLGLLAAAVPAIWAARVPALESIRPPATGRGRWPRAWPLLVIGAAISSYLVFRSGGGVGVAVGAILAYLAICSSLGWLGPWLVTWLGATLGYLLGAPLAAITARTKAHPGTTALALASLFVSVATATSLVGLSASAMGAGQVWVDHLFVGNDLVVSPVPQSTHVEQELLASISKSAGSSALYAVAPVRFLTARIGHRAVSLAVTDASGYAVGGALQFIHGNRTSALVQVEAGSGALLPLQLAHSLDAGVGSLLTVNTGSGSGRFRVVGVVAHTLPGGSGQESMVVASSAAVHDFGSVASGFDVLQLQTRGPASVQRAVSLAAFRYGMEEESVASIRQGVDSGIQHDIAAFTALALVGVVVAVLAAINTVLLGAREGARDMALLRVVGLSRSAVRRVVLAEVLATAVAGCGLGILAGIGLIGPEVGAASTPALPLPFVVPVAGVVALAVAAVAAVALSAIVPARQLSKLDPVAALAVE